MMKTKVYIGCIADDFTGATDIASFLSDRGMQTMMFNGIPSELPDPLPQAVVIALKTRSITAQEAVDQSREAVRYLQKLGTKQIYFKYCSTFDSTPAGNIGPVADSLMDMLDVTYTVLCPSLPVNGRCVRDGKISVNGVPLHKSPMKDHPINPMWDDSISELMKEQSQFPVFVYPQSHMDMGVAFLNKFISEKARQYAHFYLVPDYENERQGKQIASFFESLPLITGGSGLAASLAEKILEKENTEIEEPLIAETSSHAVILAGSCSAMTLKQIRNYLESGEPAFRIIPEKLLDGTQTPEELRDFMRSNSGKNILFYSSAPAEAICKKQTDTNENVSGMLENLMKELACQALEEGFRRIIVAGGETSGAVTQGLGFDAYHVGETVAPGVPVMIPQLRPDVRLVLKSGNFGREDFFWEAIRKTANTEVSKKG